MSDGRASGIRRYVPILSWLPGYRRRGTFRADVVAGISVAALLIPGSMGYAEIAGLPPEVGLYAAPAALIAYVVFGGSKLLVVATASGVSAVSASIIGSFAAGDEGAAIALSAALAIVAGLIFLVAGIARMGWVANFMSKAVREGFVVGLSIGIIIGQLDSLVGVEVEGGDSLAELADVLSQFLSWDALTVAFGVGSLALLFVMDRYMRRVPGALTVVVLGILLVSIFNLDEQGLAIVGEIPSGLPDIGVPNIDASQWLSLIPGGLAIVLVGFSEGYSAAKDVAEPGAGIDANQELIGYGASSVGAGLSGGMVVSGSLSKTGANRDAGGSSQVANIVNALIVLLTLLFLAPLFANLPEATLSAIVIHAVWRIADPRRLMSFRRILPIEFWIAVVVLAAVLLVGAIQAVALGVVISLLIVIYQVSFPRTAELGRDSSTGQLVGLDTHPHAVSLSGVLIYRFDAPLIYSNAEAFTQSAERFLRSRETEVKRMVIDCEVMSDIDATGAEALVALVSSLHQDGIDVKIIRVHRLVYQALERGGAIETIGADAFVKNPDDALPKPE
jgi:SulP family sulfate permease